MVLLQRQIYFFKDPMWVQHFQGIQLFFGGGGGPNAYFYSNP